LPILAIRTHASPSYGIGHLARTFCLATSLVKYGLEIHFFLDNENSFFKKYLHPFHYTCLYHGGETFQDEVSDACRFMDAKKGHQILAVLVDDYRFTRVWEDNVEKLDCPLIVLDDRNSVQHKCSMIIDAKWVGIVTCERYLHKVPDYCLRLLGPKYVLIDGSYVNKGRTSDSHTSKNVISIMVSLGGGGDIKIARKIVEKLLSNAPSNTKFIVRPVIGPFATNKEAIFSISEKDRRVKPISNARSLYGYLKTTTLYIGASGGTLYQGLSMNIPMLTFALAENQNNQLCHLEDLGHYFHLNDFGEKSFNKLAKLAWAIISNIERIQHLYALPKKMGIDGLGAERVAKVIDSLIKEEQTQKTQYSSESTKQQSDVTDDGQDYVFERVDDRHINRYLDARNLDENLQNMTETEKIGHLDHYLWWLNTKRLSYLLRKDEKPKLYIWHLPRTVEGTTVLTGGWFVCSETCTAFDALHGLKRQLELTDKLFKGVTWVAVIKRTNHFVMSLNKRFGFEIMDKSHPLFRIAGQCFPYAKTEEFHFLTRKSTSNTLLPKL
jgi:spore coat polysaccharide biosynthesis predicted glycosyltransferase SpsG